MEGIERAGTEERTSVGLLEERVATSLAEEKVFELLVVIVSLVAKGVDVEVEGGGSASEVGFAGSSIASCSVATPSNLNTYCPVSVKSSRPNPAKFLRRQETKLAK